MKKHSIQVIAFAFAIAMTGSSSGFVLAQEAESEDLATKCGAEELYGEWYTLKPDETLDVYWLGDESSDPDIGTGLTTVLLIEPERYHELRYGPDDPVSNYPEGLMLLSMEFGESGSYKSGCGTFFTLELNISK